MRSPTDVPIHDLRAVPDEVRQNHLHLCPTDWAWRRHALEHPALWAPETFSALEGPLPLMHQEGCQAWPTFVAPERMEELARATRELMRLIRTLPERVFDGDVERLAAFYGLFQPTMLEILLAEPNGLDAALARGDFVWTPRGLRCLEINASPASGGWEMTALADRFLAVPVLTSWIESQDLSIRFHDPLETLFEHVLDTVEDHVKDAGSEVDVAFVLDPGVSMAERDGDKTFLEEGYRPVRERRGVAGRTLYCTADRLQVRRGTALVDGRRVHAVVELSAAPTRPELYRVFKAGRVALLNGPLEPMLADKRNLALLSEHAASDRFDAEERETIRRHVPWTRIVRPGESTFEDQTVDLVPFVEAERQRLVLKPPLERGGKGVALGIFETAESWRAALDEALAAGDWLVQERASSRKYLERWGRGDDAGGWPHERIWGPFVCGDRFAGVMLREQPVFTAAPINASLGEATVSTVFEVAS